MIERLGLKVLRRYFDETMLKFERFVELRKNIACAENREAALKLISDNIGGYTDP